MSKIVCFVAMAHHSRFLFPVVEALKEKGNERLYFTTSSDFPFEAHAYKKGLDCPLVQSYCNTEIEQKIKNSTEKFFEKWKDHIWTLNAMQQWPLTSSINLISSAIREYYCIEEFFKQEKPDLVMALNERNRWGQLFGHLCRKYKIPYITFMEGDYYENRLSFNIHGVYSSKLLVWGQYSKDFLINGHNVDPNKLILTGNTHLQGAINQPVDKEKVFKKYGLDPNKKTVYMNVGIQWGVRFQDRQWENFLPFFQNNKEWQVLVSWHPKVTYNSYQTINKYMRDKFKGIQFYHSVSLYDVIPVVDWVVALGKTTSAVEALCWNKPLITSKGFDGQPDVLYEAKVSQALNPQVKQNWKMLNQEIPEEIKEGSEKFIENYFYKKNSQAVEIAVDQAEQLMNQDYIDPWNSNFDEQFLEMIKE